MASTYRVQFEYTVKGYAVISAASDKDAAKHLKDEFKEYGVEDEALYDITDHKIIVNGEEVK